ncbi:hypothetical protein EAW52_10650 [Pseudomonas sp. LTJR-52]|uniref:hypothetical protein n=1 Tax=Pseudomonas sp. LTJR-52 TaxID=2479392 RepID=UPI000EFD3AD3|nr:hypothetical protein [Pseudomonas sp. LTJR-52]AYN94386.1 hypothetical protein EAW52_10650 [Pseudomonas sp. LTJR-52]
MSSRELLELAAKAAGYRIKFGASGDPYIQAGMNTRAWNPLTDDGDALRLAVKLDINIRYHSVLGQAFAKNAGIERQIEQNVEECNSDRYQATRRAIVLAAAEVGRTMP